MASSLQIGSFKNKADLDKKLTDYKQLLAASIRVAKRNEDAFKNAYTTEGISIPQVEPMKYKNVEQELMDQNLQYQRAFQTIQSLFKYPADAKSVIDQLADNYTLSDVNKYLPTFLTELKTTDLNPRYFLSQWDRYYTRLQSQGDNLIQVGILDDKARYLYQQDVNKIMKFLKTEGQGRFTPLQLRQLQRKFNERVQKIGIDEREDIGIKKLSSLIDEYKRGAIEIVPEGKTVEERKSSIQEQQSKIIGKLLENVVNESGVDFGRAKEKVKLIKEQLKEKVEPQVIPRLTSEVMEPLVKVAEKRRQQISDSFDRRINALQSELERLKSEDLSAGLEKYKQIGRDLAKQERVYRKSIQEEIQRTEEEYKSGNLTEEQFNSQVDLLVELRKEGLSEERAKLTEAYKKDKAKIKEKLASREKAIVETSKKLSQVEKSKEERLERLKPRIPRVPAPEIEMKVPELESKEPSSGEPSGRSIVSSEGYLTRNGTLQANLSKKILVDLYTKIYQNPPDKSTKITELRTAISNSFKPVGSGIRNGQKIIKISDIVEALPHLKRAKKYGGKIHNAAEIKKRLKKGGVPIQHGGVLGIALPLIMSLLSQ